MAISHHSNPVATRGRNTYDGSYYFALRATKIQKQLMIVSRYQPLADEFINKGLQIQTNTSIDPGIDTLQLAFDQSSDKHNHRFSLSESYPGLRIFTKISSSCALWTVIRARLIIKETPFPHSLHVNAKIQLVRRKKE
jgi:hypothetical protein